MNVNKRVAVICLRRVETPIITFQIKKRIITELLISAKQGLYMQKERIKKISDLIEEGKWKWAETCANANK